MSAVGPFENHTDNATLAIQGMMKNSELAVGIEELHYATVTVTQTRRKVLRRCESAWGDEALVDETLQ